MLLSITIPVCFSFFLSLHFYHSENLSFPPLPNNTFLSLFLLFSLSLSLSPPSFLFSWTIKYPWSLNILPLFLSPLSSSYIFPFSFFTSVAPHITHSTVFLFHFLFLIEAAIFLRLHFLSLYFPSFLLAMKAIISHYYITSFILLFSPIPQPFSNSFFFVPLSQHWFQQFLSSYSVSARHIFSFVLFFIARVAEPSERPTYR